MKTLLILLITLGTLMAQQMCFDGVVVGFEDTDGTAWLTIYRPDLMHPLTTQITSRYHPVVHQSDNQWEITFR